MKALVAAATRIGMPQNVLQDRHLDDPAAEAEQARDGSGQERRAEASGQAPHAVDVGRVALLEPAAQAAGVDVEVGDHVAPARARAP